MRCSRTHSSLALSLATAVWLSGWSLSVGAQTITEFQFPIPRALPNICAPTALPLGITTGPDGALWFNPDACIGRVTPSGAFTFYSSVAANGGPVLGIGGITMGSDAALWFTGGVPGVGKL